jgi:hypothetical protein
MAWRKVHFGNEVWEWQVSKSCADEDGTPQIVIRAPSGVITTVVWDRWETVWDGNNRHRPIKVLAEIIPSTVKAHIERNRATLMVKPEKRRKKGT